MACHDALYRCHCTCMYVNKCDEDFEITKNMRDFLDLVVGAYRRRDA